MAKAKIPSTEAPGVEVEETESTGVAIITPIAERPAFIDLIKYSAKEESLATIKAKRAEYDLITIDGVEDTANYKLVVANMGQMKKDRMAFENAAYDNVIDPLKTALKEYAADIDAIVNEFKSAEKAERDKKDFIDEEKKRIKKEKEEAKERAALLRVNELNVLGATYNGSTYTFSYDDSLVINTLQIKDFDDQEWEEFLAEAKEAFDKEQERINNQLAADELEAERLRLQAIKDKELLDAANEKVRKVREKELVRVLGYSYNEIEEEYLHPTIHIPVAAELLSTSDEEEWEALIYDIEHYEAPVEPEPEPVVEEPEQSNTFSGPGSAGSRFEVLSVPPTAIDELKEELSGGDDSVPVSTLFYLSDVIDYSDKDIRDEESFREWAAEELIDDVRENTPHAEQGAMENTLCFKWQGKYWEVTIDNIQWNRYDKQYYFIDMYESPNLVIKEVRMPEGTRPILTKNVTLLFNQQQPFTDCDLSMKLKLRVFPEEYADKAKDGVAAYGAEGKIQDLNWIIIPK